MFEFIELSSFSDGVRRLGLDDDDLRAIQLEIMADPEGWPAIPGGGGLRKMRFAPAGWAGGKSGGARVCYALHVPHSTALLVLIYSKNEQDEIPADQLATIRKLLGQIEKSLAARRGRRP